MSSDSGAIERRTQPSPNLPAEADRLRGTLAERFDDDLPDLAAAWVMSYSSPNTRRAYAREFDRWAAFCQKHGVHPISARRPIGDAYAHSLKGAPSTRGRALAAISAFYLYCTDLEITDHNPIGKRSRPKVTAAPRSTGALTEDDAATLIRAARADGPRTYALVTLLYTLGLRVTEALRLDVADLGYAGGHRVITVTRKGGARAELAVPPIALDALIKHLGERTDGPVFATASGKAMDQPAVWKLLRRLARTAGLPQADTIHPHTLRHGCATHLLAAGAPLHRVQDQLGHADSRTTRGYDDARGRLDDAPSYLLGKNLTARLDHDRPTPDARR